MTVDLRVYALIAAAVAVTAWLMVLYFDWRGTWRRGVLAESHGEATIDWAIEGSFPASDPPSWAPGMARPAPPEHAFRRPAPAVAGAPPAIIDPARPTAKLALAEVLTATVSAAGLTLLVPIAVLLVGLPIALAIRALVEAAGLLLGLLR